MGRLSNISGKEAVNIFKKFYYIEKIKFSFSVNFMLKIVQATCTNGELVLSEKLSPELEGKTIQIVILEQTESTQTINDGESQIHHFLEKVNNYSFLLTPDYKFNREEIYEQ